MRYRITETRQIVIDTDEWFTSAADDTPEAAEEAAADAEAKEWDTLDRQVEPLHPVPNRFSDDEVDLMMQRSRDFVE